VPGGGPDRAGNDLRGDRSDNVAEEPKLDDLLQIIPPGEDIALISCQDGQVRPGLQSRRGGVDRRVGRAVYPEDDVTAVDGVILEGEDLEVVAEKPCDGKVPHAGHRARVLIAAIAVAALGVEIGILDRPRVFGDPGQEVSTVGPGGDAR
jgi:hypothetical protein